jgi:maleate isomerase
MYYGARGIVGLVKPTYRPGSMESFIKLMPEGVGFIPFHAGIRAGNEKEFQDALAVAEKKVARLAELGADVVMIMGAPPAMVRGHGADRHLAEQLTKRYGIPVTIATIAQVDAFRALGMKKLVGITYFQEDMNQRFAKFLEDDGFEVKAMKGIDVPFKDAGKTPPEAIYTFAKMVFLEQGPVDGIYMLGAGWNNLPVIEMLERDLKTTVVSSIPAQVWATKKILHLNEPVTGYGRLLAEMP